MAKFNYDWNEKKLKRFIKEGRGSGTLENYKPFWTVHDFPSKGRVHRIKGWKTKRIHHFFSDLQKNLFLLFEWSDSVVDIREHYPLYDTDELMAESDLRFDLFTDKESNLPYVLTTNFLLTLLNDNGEEYLVAINVKNASDLKRKRTIEKFEIERRFYEKKNIEFQIVTQNEISKTFAKNVEWVHQSRFQYEQFGFSLEDLETLTRLLKDKFSRENKRVDKILEAFDFEYNFESGTGLFLLKYMIASKHIKVNMFEKIELTKKVYDLIDISKFSNEGGEEIAIAK